MRKKIGKEKNKYQIKSINTDDFGSYDIIFVKI